MRWLSGSMLMCWEVTTATWTCGTELDLTVQRAPADAVRRFDVRGPERSCGFDGFDGGGPQGRLRFDGFDRSLTGGPEVGSNLTGDLTGI